MSNPKVMLSRSQILRVLDGQTIQVPTAVGLLEVSSKSDDVWHPLKKMGDEVNPMLVAMHEQVGSRAPDEVWVNDLYEVVVFRDEGVSHLSIKRLDRAAVRNWRHLQQIKNEVCGEFEEAVELFPSEARIADNANQYHLFVIEGGIPLGFRAGAVTIADDDVEAYNKLGTKGRQEPMQPGLTVGQGMQRHQEERGISVVDELRRVTDAATRGLGARPR